MPWQSQSRHAWGKIQRGNYIQQSDDEEKKLNEKEQSGNDRH